MGDPGTYLTTKIASMLGGLFGGAAILTFIKPKTVGEAFTRGGVSVGSAIVFAGPLLNILEMRDNWEGQMMAGFCIGFVSYSILGMVANFLEKNQSKDIIEVISDVKDKNKKG